MSKGTISSLSFFILISEHIFITQDASWLLPPSFPLKCISPADVYLLLKSSDFISHDLNPEIVFDGCHLDGSSLPPYDLELVLRKWYPVDRSRELRCFVRENLLIGKDGSNPIVPPKKTTNIYIAISQRDPNFYEFWNEPNTQAKVSSAIQDFWRTNILPKWTSSADCKKSSDIFFLGYTNQVGFPSDIFDFLLTRDLSKGHILDFNPYAPKTDPLLFTYEELRDLIRPGTRLPVLRVIDSPSHPAAAANAPAHQHNMIPFEAVSMSNGLNIEEFADLWKDSLKESMKDTT